MASALASRVLASAPVSRVLASASRVLASESRVLASLTSLVHVCLNSLFIFFPLFLTGLIPGDIMVFEKH